MKRILSVILIVCMVNTIIPIIQVSAADAVSNGDVFLKQDTSYTCTLSSAAMMLRRRAYLEGNSNWSSITESAIKPIAWAPGLYNSFKYAGISVSSGKFTGTASQKKAQLISMLSAHPEGVVIYMYGDGLKTHAILATDYDSSADIIYCADPANNIAKGRIPLTSAYLTGSTQNARIGNLKKYWYVSSGNCSLTTPIAPPAPQVHIHSYNYTNDTAHPHSEYKYCSCGDKEYTGNKMLLNFCAKCYPVGNVSLTRSFEKTKGKAVFYRNNVSNADMYTLKLYKDGSLYDTYTMSSIEYRVSGLKSGKYTATLYAKNTATGQERNDSCSSFKIVDTYNVSYNANGGSNAPSSQTKIEDEALTLSASAPIRSHYVFKGWATSKKATSAKYQPGEKYTKNAKITLYAVWEPETYDIKFDANGGKGELKDTTITYGDAMRMPNTLVQDYYYLKGWSANKNSTTPEYKLGVDYKLTADTTLYAIWGQSTWNNEVSSSLAGEGTAENPYQIGSAADLAYLANKVNSQTSTPAYEYYILTDNINLVYSEWVPIGLLGNENQYFYGSFDGNGYTISDLYITQENAGNIGLFGYAKNSEIKNLNLTGAIESVTSTSSLNVGGVIGKTENTSLEKLSAMYFNIGSITAGTSDYSNMGTVAGCVNGGEITDCSSKECHIDLKSGKFTTGMIVGCCEADITNCSVYVSEDGLFSSQATVNAFQMGGLCGKLTKIAEKCTVEAPYMSNNIKTTSSTYVGGLVGNLAGEVKICTVKFTDETANSMMMSGTGSTNAGGLAGYSESSAKITDCKFDGNSINSETTSGSAYVGGLIGQATAKVNPTVSVTGGQALSKADLPTKDGYKATWYTDADYTTPYDFSQTVKSNMTLYAKWEEGEYTPDVWDGTSKEPAYNADTKTYTITNGEELAWISDVTYGTIKSGTNFPSDTKFSGYTVKLANDIYLNDVSDYQSWGENQERLHWRGPSKFKGTFDGCNHTVFGLYGASLFWYTESEAIVKDIVLRKGYVWYSAAKAATHPYVGAVVADNSGEIRNCINESVEVSAIGTVKLVGGIAGINDGVIEKCGNSANISSVDIDDEHYRAANVGGIAGGTEGIINLSWNKGDICTDGTMTDQMYAGGIAGKGSKIQNSYNSGTVRAWVVGGVVGKLIGDENIVRNCYNDGELQSENLVGGIVGADNSSEVDVLIKQCYNVGTAIKFDSGNNYFDPPTFSPYGLIASTHYGGIVTISNSYSHITPLADTTDVELNSTSYKSLSNMKNLSNLAGFDTSIWATNSNINDGYPYLKSLEETYKTYIITPVVDDNDPSTINRSFANIDGALSGKASADSYVGGIIGRGNGATNSASVAQNMITIADSISATTTGSSNKAYSGNIIGQNNGSKFTFNNAYYNSEMSVESSTNTIDTTGVARSEKTINVAFLTNILGLTQYTSLENLKNDKSAVWVLKNGELPELYYNCLNDITISKDIENGSISLDKAQGVDGEIVTVSATPNEGYVLNKIYVNGVETVGTTFEVAGDSEVYATFAEKIPEYTVTVELNENAEASLKNLDSDEGSEISLASAGNFVAGDGEEIQVDAVADTDYAIDTIYVNGEEIAGDSFIVDNNSVVTMDVVSISTEYDAITNDATDVDVYSAEVSGSVADFEGAVRYIEYWESDNPAEVYTTEVQEGSGAYSAELTGLLSNTEYSYRMTENGEIKVFTTLADGDGGESGGTEEEPVPDPEPDNSTAITATTYKTLTSTYKFTVESEKALETEVIVVGVYDGNKRAISYKKIECDGDTSYTASFPLDSNIKYAKVFVFESIVSAKPIGGVETVKIE